MSGDARLRILIVTGIFPPDTGGPATYVPILAAALAERGHQVTVLTTGDEDDGATKAGSYRVVRIGRRQFHPWRVIRTIAALLSLGRRVDVVFANGLYPETVIANLMLRRPLVFKVVGDWVWERARNRGWTVREIAEFQHLMHRPRVDVLKALRNYCARRADVVIVPSHYLGRIVTAWGIHAARIRVVANAADVPPAHGTVRIPLSTRFKVVAVGRLVSWKRIDGLLDVVRACPDDVGLIIVGDGPEGPRLTALAARLGVRERVWFAGACPPSVVTALVSAADVFVLNSTYEGLPHVVLEAMRVGTPVVATDAGGTREIVAHGHTGILVPVDDRSALIDAICGLLADPSRRRELAAGARVVSERYDVATMIRETEAVLEAAASRGSAGPSSGSLRLTEPRPRETRT